MNCHDNKNNNENTGEHNHNDNQKHKGHWLHMVLMVLCCAIPLLLIFALPLLNVENESLKNLMSGAIFLLCPLMHILMMPLMFKKDKKKNDDNKLSIDDKIEINNTEK